MKVSAHRVCILVALLAGVGAAPVMASPIELVANSDFSGGLSGFTSDLTPLTRNGDPDLLWPEGTYAVDTTAVGVHPYWVVGGDHTTGSGRFLLVNGALVGGATVWAQTFAVAPHTEYALALWAENLCCNTVAPGNGPGPSLDVLVNGVSIGQAMTDGPGVWLQSTWLWTSGPAGLITFSIRDLSDVLYGNDFGIDDISFATIVAPAGVVDAPGPGAPIDPGAPAPVPEPATWTLVGCSLALLRQRSRTRRA